jgi:hypothetical protein
MLRNVIYLSLHSLSAMDDPTTAAQSAQPQPDNATAATESAAPTQAPLSPTANPVAEAPGSPQEPPPSFVKLAMRNMVKKGGKSLFHFSLTTAALLGLLVGLAYLTR